MMVGNWYGALFGAGRTSRPIGGGGLKRFISIGILLQIIANCAPARFHDVSSSHHWADHCVAVKLSQ
ncbi:esterase/lipase/thioesterase family protein [Anopheles sinensis]|uniref:Esterase/lipase/thioesterase family protein n=1 Tax=Anopheles sinensis TaxID=74873 RepID=A0A084VW33_ANOSI|nr:esterase/lipase/thioesterase family protein [Anopheles sinensis]